jgi:hypothetical protein
MRLLFLHGLESNPQGSKVRGLRAQGFDVVAPDFRMGLLALRRENSALRMVVRLGEVRIATGAFIATTLVAAVVGSLGALGMAIMGMLLWLLLRGRALVATALKASFDASVSIARSALHDARPDVLVGSSWGGAVGAELLRAGAWTGPTILLAPAIGRVHRWARRRGIEQYNATFRERCASTHVVVFHDPEDEVVPYGEIADIVRGSTIELRSVTAGGHRLMGILHDGTLAQALHDCVAVHRGACQYSP